MPLPYPGHSSASVWATHQVLRDPTGLLESMRRRHGRNFTMHLVGQPPWAMISEPEDVKTLCSLSYEHAARLAGVELVVGPQGLLELNGDEHRTARRSLNPAFSADRSRVAAAVANACTAEVLDEWERYPGQELELELRPELTRIVSSSLLRSLLDQVPPAELAPLREALPRYTAQMTSVETQALNVIFKTRRLHAWMDWTEARLDGWPSWAQRLLGRVAIGDAVLARHRARGALAEVLARGQLPSALRRGVAGPHSMDASNNDGRQMSISALFSLFSSLLVAGIETTTIALCWTLDLLMRHPEVLARLREELGDVPLAPDRLRECRYLDAIIHESLRVRTCVPFFARKLLRPLALSRAELPASTAMVVAVHLVHHDPELWPDPERFDPERMLVRRPPPGTYIPWGAGPWRCLGGAMAEDQLRVVVAQVVQRFDLEPRYQGTPRAQYRPPTMSPAIPLKVRVRARAQAR